MHETCKHANFMFQFEIKIYYPFIFFNFFFSKYPVFGYLPKPRVNTWVNTKKIFTYPLGIYPPHITTSRCVKDMISIFHKLETWTRLSYRLICRQIVQLIEKELRLCL